MSALATASSNYDRSDIASLIVNRLQQDLPQLQKSYANSGKIPYIVIDRLLPDELAKNIASVFPASSDMTFKSTLRERKYISSQLNRFDGLMEEIVFAFHDVRVVTLMEQITGHIPLSADPMLYAGGISSMEKGGFLNPHIDNSHNKDRTAWRALNLLYYVSPDWHEHAGGSLELWPNGMKGVPVTIPCLFNRLVVMATHQHSLHSVNRIQGDEPRNCISNYFFSSIAMHPEQAFHITAFRGRPEQKWRDLALRGDAKLRMLLRKIKSSGFFQTGHWYR